MDLKCLKLGLVLIFLFSSIFCKAGDILIENNPQDTVHLTGHRFLTFNTVIRVNQIEVSRNRNVGEDERTLHTSSKVVEFREAIATGFPGAKITWAFSWLALHDTSANYSKIRELVVGYHHKDDDEITFIPEMLHTSAIHFDRGFELNGFVWVTNCWELCLPYDFSNLTQWLSEIKKRWPDVKMIPQGEFGMIWRQHYKTNSFNYRFEEKGSGIGGSDADKEIRWYMNKEFRLAILKDLKTKEENIIDFTRYDLKAKEPESGSTRNWTLYGDINQKQTRKQDTPIPKDKLSKDQKTIITRYYPNLLKSNK